MVEQQINNREDDMAIDRTLKLAILPAAIIIGCAGPATAQACSHEGPAVT
jgi:hypothetical protein